MKFYVRKNLNDAVELSYDSIYDAIENCNYGDIILDENGQPILININQQRKESNYETLWNKLKIMYKGKLKEAKKGSGLALETLRVVYTDLLKKMEELEKGTLTED